MKRFIAALVILLLVTSCSNSSTASSSAETNNEPIKVNQEDLNTPDFEIVSTDMSKYTQLLDQNHVFKQITMLDSYRFFDENASGVLYFGKPGCPFCQIVTPLVNNAARTVGVNIYYVDVSADTSANMEIYQGIADRLGDTIINQETGEEEFMVPNLFIIKNGKIVDHQVGTPQDDFDESDQQKDDAREYYQEMMRKLA